MANRLSHHACRQAGIAYRKPLIADNKNKIIFLVGPTAVGKTEVAIQLAKKINAEIISCDSMQVYIGMDIITSKPSIFLRKKIPHYLIDIVSPEEEYSVVDYQRQSTSKIKDILKKGKTPLFVGGTGFYLNVLLDGIFSEDIKNKEIRDRLYKQAEKSGIDRLYRRLTKIDPQAALKIHPHDLRRIVRALEVYENTKIPISELQKKRKGISQDYKVKVFCLNRDRAQLYKRIDRRVEHMFKKGVVTEVKRLLNLRLSKTASQAIGIKEIKGYLEKQYDLKEAKQLLERNNRHYAKRQISWFRKDKRIEWVELGDKETVASVADRILKELETSVASRDSPLQG